ncbi:MAG: hypothetical protein K8S55_07635, partial [Phycisphaerae bacterium]|nr:hypothetical protein [Phycisphaerae bacterium]
SRLRPSCSTSRGVKPAVAIHNCRETDTQADSFRLLGGIINLTPYVCAAVAGMNFTPSIPSMAIIKMQLACQTR